MKLTRQQCAQGIYDHFVVNKSRFAYSNEHGLCRYRTETGAKCAVGCLIPDEMYDSSMECSNISNLFYFHARSRILKMFNENDIQFLKTCQNWHDDGAQWSLSSSPSPKKTDFMALRRIFVENGIDVSDMPLLPQ